MLDSYLARKKTWDKDFAEHLERELTLRVIDRNWTQQIDNMARFRESVSLRSYAQINPLQDYVNEGWAMFREMNEVIALEVVLNLLNVKVEVQEEKKENFVPQVDTSKQEEKKEESETVIKKEDDAKPVINGNTVGPSVSMADSRMTDLHAKNMQETQDRVAKAEAQNKLEQPNLNISDIDKDKKAAEDIDESRIHTN